MLSNLFRRPAVEKRSALSMSDYASMFSYAGHQFSIPQTWSPGRAKWLEQIGQNAYQSNGIVFACTAVRISAFSEITFAYQRWQAGRPGNLWSDATLSALETPWPGGTTSDLLQRVGLDDTVAGNSYWINDGSFVRNDRPTLLRIDPARVMILTGTVSDPESGVKLGNVLAGYAVSDGPNSDGVAILLPNEVAHYRPPTPSSSEFLGASWLSSVLPDVRSDSELTAYKEAFLQNAATPNMVVTFDPEVSEEAFEAVVAAVESGHAGAGNAFKTLYLGGGADVKTVGATLEQLQIKATQGAGETRIAAAAGTPATVVGLSEGMQGSSLNAGNYVATRRRFGDLTMRPMWRAVCGAFGSLVTPPPDSRLWFDERDVPFLQEDVGDDAEIRQANAGTINTLIMAGYKPDAVVDAVMTGDLKRLSGQHTGLFSVQLQAPGATTAPPAPAV